MQEVKKKLLNRKEKLLKIKKQKEKALLKVPEGTLRICNREKKPIYYVRRDPKDKNGLYIKENEQKLAVKLAQKEYDKKILRCIEKELGAIERFLALYPKCNLEEIYETLHKERQKLVIPVRETDEQYISNWEKEEYEGKGFGVNTPELYTSKGERVRSKSEVIIADLLNKEGIPYRYEYPLYLKGFDVVYPDFTILNIRKRKDIYWEHFGMMDNPEYVEKAIRKIALYEQNGIYPGENLIMTFETKQNPMNQKQVGSIVDRMLK